MPKRKASGGLGKNATVKKIRAKLNHKANAQAKRGDKIEKTKPSLTGVDGDSQKRKKLKQQDEEQKKKMQSKVEAEEEVAEESGDESSDFSELDGEGQEDNKAPAPSPEELKVGLEKAHAAITAAKKAPKNKNPKAGTIYLGHLPHGFFEQQIKKFFSQFGDVTRLKVPRNKKSGNFRHYAFVEFKEKEVAAICADTMNGYMLFGKTLKSHVVDSEDSNEFKWKNSEKGFKKKPWAQIARKRHNKEQTEEQTQKRTRALLKREAKKRATLKALGIEYEFPGYAEQAEAK